MTVNVACNECDLVTDYPGVSSLEEAKKQFFKEYCRNCDGLGDCFGTSAWRVEI